MRSPSQPHSVLRFPLNHLLGTEVNMRILRLLAMNTVPMSKSEIARRTALNASGVGRSIEELADMAIIGSLGTGSRRLYHLRAEHPLARPLAELFEAEQDRFVSLIDGLREAAHQLKPPPHAAWIQGPVTREVDELGDPLSVRILASARDIDRMVEYLWAEVRMLESDFDVTISVQGLTLADFPMLAPEERADLETTISLLGPPPLAIFSEVDIDQKRLPAGSHQELDRRALDFAKAVAEKLSGDPSLVDQARKYIKRRLRLASSSERKVHEEWDRILRTMPIGRLKKFLVESSERATRLRQSLPFVGVLSREELEELRKTGHDER